MLYKNFFKHIIDITVAIILLLLSLPLTIGAALLLAISNGGSPFFFQVRPGKNERLFKIIKFKTMNDKTDDTGELLPDVERLTFVGKWVRKLSLDELPQLINVLKGDISLIGPRPLLVEYLPLYNEQQRKRHLVKPGISGWAQVNGRNSISWEQKFDHDVYYVENLSFALDVKILFMTIYKILKTDGISADGEATMTKFTGTLDKFK